MIAKATRKVLLADHSKWKNPSTVHFADWSHFTDWVTDAMPDPDQTSQLSSLGLKIHVA